ncbi:MAG TPA: 2-phospho-L-lactate transferase [Nitrolancea sp.]|jgi:LPPG:FO 2-phospho-L-lactate transferase|nr:2-phospho-L-lactate transferase [Nitrolancea sp.]
MGIRSGSIVALAGGVGGAKLADGLNAIDDPRGLTVIVNTADDFTLHGLHISPDLDTVLYTLAGIANPETGWGIAGDTFVTMAALARLGGADWFRLGDQDFATHIRRTQRLGEGATLSDVTEEFTRALGVRTTTNIVPMTDDRVATLVETGDGLLDFQSYFVRRQHADRVLSVRFDGIEQATMSVRAKTALDAVDVVVICPSNPIVSIGPILALPNAYEALRAVTAPVVAVSPIIGGQALKGPADRMLASLGHQATALGVATIYREFLSGMVIDEADAHLAERIEELGMAVLVTDTIMRDTADRRRLAGEVLDFAETVRR